MRDVRSDIAEKVLPFGGSQTMRFAIGIPDRSTTAIAQKGAQFDVQFPSFAINRLTLRVNHAG
jgi:hypothetical protein